MNAEGVSPARHEVERQLDRMFADEVIASHPQAAKLLAFIVHRALEGEEITEELIRQGVFPYPKPYKEDSNIARITMKKVRELLADYYADAGEDDPVIIALPRSPEGKRIKFQAGEAYTPQFSYNPRSPIAQAFAIADHLMRGGRLEVERSLWNLDAIYKIAPDHPGVMLAIAESVGAHVLADIYGEAARPALVAGALAWIDRLDPAQADAWRIQNVRGLLHFCGGELERAGEAFNSALALDAQATISRGWYIHFLFASGREEEALRFLSLLAEESASNAKIWAVHGLYLNKAKRYEEATRAFAHALSLDRNCWPAYYGLVQIQLATGEHENAEEHLKRLETLVEPSEYEELKRRLDSQPHMP